MFLGGHEEGGNGSRLVPLNASEAGSAENLQGLFTMLSRVLQRKVASSLPPCHLYLLYSSGLAGEVRGGGGAGKTEYRCMMQYR